MYMCFSPHISTFEIFRHPKHRMRALRIDSLIRQLSPHGVSDHTHMAKVRNSICLFFRGFTERCQRQQVRSPAGTSWGKSRAENRGGAMTDHPDPHFPNTQFKKTNTHFIATCLLSKFRHGDACSAVPSWRTVTWVADHDMWIHHEIDHTMDVGR